MRIMLLGFCVSSEIMRTIEKTDKNSPAQTQRFGWSLVHAVRAAGADVSLIVTEPVTDFPHNFRLLVAPKRFTEDGQAGKTVPFVNVSPLKHITRLISGLAISRRDARAADAILVHGLNSSMLWVGIIRARRRGLPVVVVVTDAPGLRTSFDNSWTGLLKRLDSRFITSGMRRVSGVIALTERLAETQGQGHPCLVMEGISPRMESTSPPSRDDNVRVVYAGGVKREYGVFDLVEAVKRSAGRWTVDVYGMGPDLAELQALASGEAQVRVHGYVSPDQIAAVYSAADVLVNPRPVTAAVVQESFPSKLLEYMSAGRPVVSTSLPTIPADYLEYLVVADEGVEGLARAIDSVAAMGREQRIALGESTHRFITSTRGPQVQGDRIVAFLESLGARRG